MLMVKTETSAGRPADGLAGGVLAKPGLEDVAVDEFVDGFGFYAAGQRFLDDDSAHFGGGEGGQRAVEAAAGCGLLW